MKKLACLIMTAVLTLGLMTGCGQSTTEDNANTNGDSAAKIEDTADNASSEVSELNAVNGTLDPENPITITFYSYSLGAPTMKAGMEHLINSFNEGIGKEKGIIVEGVEDLTMSKYQTDIAAGEQVNIIQHTFPTLDVSRENLGIQAYEDIFAADELSEHLSHMYENAIELGKLDGKTYALAFTFSTPILYINGALFEAAGLDPNQPPTTWAEVKEYAQKIYDATGKPGFGLAPDNGWTTEGVLFSNGAETMDEDGKMVFASDEGVEAYEMWQELYQSGAHALGGENEIVEQFMSGNLGMNLQSTSVLSGYKASAEAGGWELYGAQMPQFGDKESVPVNSGSALAVRSTSASESLAIWEFVKYVTGAEGYTIITSEVGYLPLNKEIVDDPAYLKDFVDANPIIRTNLDQLERLQPVTIWPGENAIELRQIFMDATVKAVTTTGDVKEILTEAQDQMNALSGK